MKIRKADGSTEVFTAGGEVSTEVIAAALATYIADNPLSTTQATVVQRDYNQATLQTAADASLSGNTGLWVVANQQSGTQGIPVGNVSAGTGVTLPDAVSGIVNLPPGTLCRIRSGTDILVMFIPGSGGGGTAQTGAEIVELLEALSEGNRLSAEFVDGLADVATSGSYNDLTDKPTIPAAAENLSDLEDVTISDPKEGQQLIRRGSVFVNEDPPGGGGGGATTFLGLTDTPNAYTQFIERPRFEYPRVNAAGTGIEFSTTPGADVARDIEREPDNNKLDYDTGLKNKPTLPTTEQLTALASLGIITIQAVGGDAPTQMLGDETNPVSVPLSDGLGNHLLGNVTGTYTNSSGVSQGSWTIAASDLPTSRPSIFNIRAGFINQFIWIEDNKIMLDSGEGFDSSSHWSSITFQVDRNFAIRQGLISPTGGGGGSITDTNSYFIDVWVRTPKGATISSTPFTSPGTWNNNQSAPAFTAKPTENIANGTVFDINDLPATAADSENFDYHHFRRVFTIGETNVPNNAWKYVGLYTHNMGGGARRYLINAYLRLTGTDTPTATSLTSAGTWDDATQSFSTEPTHGTLGDVFDRSNLPADAFSSTTHGYWEYERYFTVGETGITASA